MIKPPERQQGPLDQYGAMMQLRAMGDQSALHGLQRRKLEDDLAEEAAFKASISDWVQAGGKGALTPQAWSASPTRAAAFEKQRTEAEAKRGEIDHRRVQTLAEQAKLVRDQLAGVTDQASYDLWRNAGIQAGHQAALQAPQEFDPQWQRRQVMTADKFVEQAAPEYEWRTDGQSERLYQTNPLAGKIGVVDGAPVIAKKMTPAEADSAKRQWAQLNQPVWDPERGVFVSRPLAGPVPAQGGAAPNFIPVGAPAGASADATTAPPGAPRVIPVADLPPRPQPQEKPPAGYRWAADGKSLEAIPGGPATKIPEAQQKQVVGVNNLKNAITEYRNALSGFGLLDMANPNARAKMGTIYNNMMLQAKEAFNLGVLNGPDYSILQEVVTNPTSLKAGLVSKEALDAQAAKLDEIMTKVGQVASTSVHTTPGGATPPPAPKVDTRGFKVIRVQKQ